MPHDVPEREDSTVATALAAVTRFASGHPFLVLALIGLLSLASIGLSVQKLGFKTNRADLIDPAADYQRRWLTYTDAFGDLSDIVVVVEGRDPDTIKQVLEEVGSRLQQENELFINVQYKVDTTDLRRKGLQYLSPQQLEVLLERLQEFGPVLRGKWNLFNLRTLYQGLRFQLSRVQQAPDPAMAEQAAEPLLEMVHRLSQSLSAFAANRGYNSPWHDLVPLEDSQRAEANQVRYFLNEAGTFGFVLALPKPVENDFEGPTQAIDHARALIAEVGGRFPGVRLGLTGIPVLENDEMRSSQDSMFWASIISFVGVGLLLMTGFRGFRHPLIGLTMLGVGTIWAFGFSTLAVGHLNILSVSFVTILVGLGIDYGILYVSRYLEARHEGQELQPALLTTSRTVGPGILTAAVTTSLAFFTAIFTDFLGVAELGIIAGGGILCCALAAFFALPSLISVLDRRSPAARLPHPYEGKTLRFLGTRFPVVVVLGAIVLIITIGMNGFRVRYDYNLLNLQAEGVESVELQERIIEESDTRLLFAVSLANSAEEALEMKRKYEALPEVHHVDELASFLPPHPPEDTLLQVQAINAMLGRLPTEVPSPTDIDPSAIGQRIEQLYEALEGFKSPLALQTREVLDRFLNQLDTLPLERQLQIFQEYQYRMTADLLARLNGLASAANPEPVGLNDLPEGMAARFVSPQGKWLLQIYPRNEIWEIEPLTAFVNAVRTVDPDVTGTPLQNYEASGEIRRSYQTIALYALFATLLVLLVDFLNFRDALLAIFGPLAGTVLIAAASTALGNEFSWLHAALAYIGMVIALVALIDFTGLRDALLAMLPPTAGAALMMGILGLLRVDLNPANLIVLPLIVGIGVDSGVHVLHDYRLQPRQYRPSSSTLNSVTLTGLTTMVGFGSMIIAPHRGLMSLGVVLTVGVGSCLFVSLILLPAILTLLSRSRDQAAGGAAGDTGDTDAGDDPRRGLHVVYPESAA